MEFTTMAKITFVLVGPRAGKDFYIPSADVQFTGGTYDHPTSGPADPSVATLINILGNLYNAHPQGSDELAAAEDAWEAQQGAPEPENLEDMSNKDLIAYALEHFQATVKGNKTELLNQIGHLQKLADEKV
jgi:hypothetical protein